MVPVLVILAIYAGLTTLGLVLQARQRRADARLATWRLQHDGPVFADLRASCNERHPNDRSWDYGIDELVRRSRPQTSTPNPSRRHMSGGKPWPSRRARSSS